jgi:paraquat-inducible protein B
VPYPELPTVTGGFESILAAVDRFVGQLDQIDIVSIANNLDGTLEGTRELLELPELQQSIERLRNILRDIDEANVDEAIVAARNVLLQIETALQPSSPLHYNMVQVTAELEETARAIRALVELLERRPQALIFGPGGED